MAYTESFANTPRRCRPTADCHSPGVPSEEHPSPISGYVINMIDVVVTRRAQRILRSGRLTPHREAWEAESTDGRWHFERIEDTGTPWLVTCDLAPGWHTLFGSLKRARAGAEAELAFEFCQGWIRAMGLERPAAQRMRIYVA